MFAVTSLFALSLSLQPAPLPRASLDTAVLAGGCFWGVEGVFEHVKGVVQVVSGFAGATGQTGQAETVEIVFDPSRVSFGQLLQIFFLIAHDPTQLNRQGPDEGPEYRSIAFYKDATQRQAIGDALAWLRRKQVYADSVVTEVQAFRAFLKAGPEHQSFMQHHLNDPYIVANDLSKLDALQHQFPTLYRAEWHD